MVLTILGVIFLTSLITFVLVKNSNPNSRYRTYIDDYEDDDDEEEEGEDEDEDELIEDITVALETMGFKKREINRALYACPPDPYLPAEDNVRDILQYLGKRGNIPR